MRVPKYISLNNKKQNKQLKLIKSIEYKKSQNEYEVIKQRADRLIIMLGL
jgi:hypothetical protein